jgi:hypothetical protein
VELATFGIERDAYFFNLIWASYNLLFWSARCSWPGSAAAPQEDRVPASCRRGS